MRNVPSDGIPSQIITIDAEPGNIAIDIAKTAVIVVDMQNDFGTVGGMFERAGIDISMIQAVVEPTAKVLNVARTAGIQIIYLKMGFQPDLSDAGSSDAPNLVRHLRMNVGETVYAPDGRESRILIRDTWNTDIVAGLEPQTGDITLYKHRFSGFYQTDLDAILKEHGVKYLIVVGCTTSICVESTIRDAMFRDYLSILLKDCAAEPLGYGLSRSNHEASLLNIQALLGWVADSAALLSALEGVPHTEALIHNS